MTSCAILISHYESLSFLGACIRQIRKYANKNIYQKIYIVDQSSKETFIGIDKAYGNDEDIEAVWLADSLYSGYGIDWIMRHGNINSEYIVQLHVDAFPIHKNWIYLPIKLIEEYNLSFVGQLHFISKETDTIYPPNNPFFSMSPTFNVARKETYEEMSTYAGFTRFHNRPQSGLEFKNNDWDEWAKADYNARGSDDDTVAFAWESNYRNTDKLGLAITGILSLTEQGSFGRIIEDIVFHFGFCRESKGNEASMGGSYLEWSEKIHNGYTDELIEEMVSIAKTNPHLAAHVSGTSERNFWNGTTKKVSPALEDLNRRIEELKGNVGCQFTEWEVKEKFTISMTDAEIKEMNKRIKE